MTRLGTRAELSELARLAVPLVVHQFGFQAMGMVDAVILGHYSDDALAGAGTGNNLLFVITALGSGLVMGLESVLPQALGAELRDDARRATSAGVRLAVVVGLAATLVVFALPSLLAVAGVAPAVTDQAGPYLYVRALGIVPFLVTVAARSSLAAHGWTRPLLLAVLGGNVVNAGLDLILVFGSPALGLPPLGVIGAATSTLVVQIATLAVYGRAMQRLDVGATVRPGLADMIQIARFGWPIAGQIFAEVGIFAIAAVFAGRLGQVPATAHSLAISFASFTFSIALGVASATSVRVGRAVGAGDRALARRRGLLGLGLGTAGMSAVAVALVAAPSSIARLYSGDPTVVGAAVPLLEIAALFQLSDGAQAIMAGALRGVRDPRATLIGNLIGHYAIGLPAMVVLAFTARLGVPGVWFGLSLGLTATALVLVAAFLRTVRLRS